MPIRETPSITENDRALRLFTDRLAERRLFARYLHADPPLKRLLFFHGDGGNGKSLPLKRLATGDCRRVPTADRQRLDAIGDDADFIEGLEAAGEAAEVPYLYHDPGAQDSGEDRPREDWSAPIDLLTTSSTVSLATKVIGLFGKHRKTDAALWLAKRGLHRGRKDSTIGAGATE